MTSAKLAERLQEKIAWSELRSITGNGEDVRRALGQLLESENADASEHVYWGIENVAFAQGELFEVSEACTSVLIAALADPRPRWVRIAVLELLFQILSGHASGRPSTTSDLVQRCRDAAREGLCLLVREAISGERDAALDVLDALGEGDRARRLLRD